MRLSSRRRDGIAVPSAAETLIGQLKTGKASRALKAVVAGGRSLNSLKGAKVRDRAIDLEVDRLVL